MTDQPVKRYEDVPAIRLCSRAALDEFLSRYWPELLRQINDFSRTDAARVEAERKVNAAIYERDVLLSRISALESDLSAVTASLTELASMQSRLAEVEGLRGALQTVDSDIDYALRRANTNGDGSMDHLSATRLIMALATIKAALHPRTGEGEK